MVVVVDSLVKVYGDNGYVGPISLSMKKGEVYGLVGPNGSGKTTTLRAILGLLKPTRGKVSVFGMDPFNNPEKVNQMVGYSPEIPVFPSFFTARKLLSLSCQLKGLRGKDVAEEVERILDLTGLVNHADRKVGNFSKGMVQRLSIGQALVGDPELLVLDEPMLGVDPVGRAHIREILQGLRRIGKTILFSSHELYEVERLSDKVGMVYLGKTVLENAVSELISQNGFQRSVQAVVKKPVDDRLVDALSVVEGVKSVHADGVVLTVDLEGLNDPRDKIAETIVASGYGLVELKTTSPSLEQVFIKMVKNGAAT
ncbi:MAG: ABC transporter ATP-binding protein [Candidatus Caldarchaeum sp.]|nr:ABC transporter ATP-binding protein [Candidatus Caldarchaeum sp.]MDW7978485.1 ABC transporter ATP-binding protein [Candidatus Caldarchaeum sp.]